MVVRNEATTVIRAILDARPYVDEVVVVDQSSDDGTWEVLKQLEREGVVDSCMADEPRGYCEASRQLAHDRSTGDWILVLDADERLSDELKQDLRSYVDSPSADGYRLPRTTYYDGKVVFEGDHQYRLFKRGAARYLDELHTQPQPVGKVITLKQGLVHEKSMAEALNDQKRYYGILKKSRDRLRARKLAYNVQLNTVRGGWKEVDGWLSPAEAALLAEIVSNVADPVVEVGSYCGRSTLVLAAWVPAGVKVYAVDPHEGIIGAEGALEQREPTWETFIANMEKWNVLDSIVVPVRKKSYEVRWDGAIGLLFVDGLHDYENVKRDSKHFEEWTDLIAFHDYGTSDGVTRYVDELIVSRLWEKCGSAGSVALLRRVKP